MLDPIYVPEDFLVPAVVWTVGTPSEAESVGAGMEREPLEPRVQYFWATL